MSTPTVSVITPVYNGRRFLRGTLESVARQTMAPLEVIVVDDGSTDGSIDVLGGFTPPFPVRVLQQANKGQSAARNHGARVATGEFLAFLDQDDEWMPRHLERLSSVFREQPEVGWAYSDFDEFDAGGTIVTRSFLLEYGFTDAKRTLLSCVEADLMVLPSASILRRSAFMEVGGFDEELSGYEDDDLFVRFFRAGWVHRFLRESLTRFRIHGGGCSVSSRFLASRMRFFNKLSAMLPADDRLNRYYLRDAVAPRFFRTTLDDYVRACSVRDWQQAALSFAALETFGRELAPNMTRAVKMAVAARPRLFRLLLQLNDRLHVTRNPLLRLRPVPRADAPARPSEQRVSRAALAREERLMAVGAAERQ